MCHGISDNTSALDARTQAFPALTTAQVDRIRPLGQIRNVQPGESLFEPDDTSVPFFVLLSGQMEIVQPTLDGERPVTTHGPGGFTGEMTMISGQRCLVRGRVTEAGEFLELSRGRAADVGGEGRGTQRDSAAGIHPAASRTGPRGYGNVILMGSRHSAESLQLREFFSRNGHPYAYIDLDTDRAAQKCWTASR